MHRPGACMSQRHAGAVNKIGTVGFKGLYHGIDITGVDAAAHQERAGGSLYYRLPVAAGRIQQDVFLPEHGTDTGHAFTGPGLYVSFFLSFLISMKSFCSRRMSSSSSMGKP